MHEPSIASPFRFVYSLLLVVGLIASSVVVLAIITDDQGDTGCGGG
jgi:hypothetical protein